MRIAGGYASPADTCELTMDMLESIGWTSRGKATRGEVPHLLAGDFDATSWGKLPAGWVKTQGLRQLVEPEAPTFAMGSSIDKVLFLPGFCTPPSFLSPGDSRLLDRATI